MLTMPLLEGLDGVQKMSKSLGNYIGINEMPHEQFGKVMSISDDMMFRYYELFTEIPLRRDPSQCETGRRRRANAILWKPKPIWPFKSSRDYHGATAAEAAREEFNRVFRKREIPEEIETKRNFNCRPARSA